MVFFPPASLLISQILLYVPSSRLAGKKNLCAQMPNLLYCAPLDDEPICCFHFSLRSGAVGGNRTRSSTLEVSRATTNTPTAKIFNVKPLAAGEGLEPPFTDPKSAVLPVRRPGKGFLVLGSWF